MYPNLGTWHVWLRVFGYLLVVGNYMNYGKRTRSATGFSLDVFERMEYSTAKDGSSGKYSILMYFVEMIRKNHPELSDWNEIFDVSRSLIDRDDDGTLDMYVEHCTY